MKTKVVSLAVLLSLFAFLGACDSGGGEGGAGDTTSPSPAESPLASPSTSP